LGDRLRGIATKQKRQNKDQDLYGAFKPKSPTSEDAISELAKNILQLIPSHINVLLPKRHGCSDGIGSLSFENLRHSSSIHTTLGMTEQSSTVSHQIVDNRLGNRSLLVDISKGFLFRL